MSSSPERSDDDDFESPKKVITKNKKVVNKRKTQKRKLAASEKKDSTLKDREDRSSSTEGQKKQRVSKRGREELPWNSSERRFDTLSRLLSCNSQCTAVALVEGQLWISANEVSSTGSVGKEQKEIIKEIMEYFRDSSKQKEDAFRWKLFEKICKNRIEMRKKMAEAHRERLPTLEEKNVSEVIKATFELKQPLGKDDKPLGGEYRSINNLCRRVRKDFRKIELLVQGKFVEEKEVKEKRKSPLSKPEVQKEEQIGDTQESKERVTVFASAIKKDYVPILSDKNPEGAYKFHAESVLVSRILYKIVEKKETIKQTYSPQKPLKIQIGIAKLCCLNCRCLLEATNEYFRKEKLPVCFEWRGKHDIAFEWHPPLLFYEGYSEGVANQMGETPLSRGRGKEGNKGNKHLRAIAQARGWEDAKPVSKEKRQLEEKQAREKEEKVLQLAKSKAISSGQDTIGKAYQKACKEIGKAAGKRVVELAKEEQRQHVSMDPESSVSETDSTKGFALHNEAEQLLNECLTLENLVKDCKLFSKESTERTYLFHALSNLRKLKFFSERIRPEELAEEKSDVEGIRRLIGLAVELLMEHDQVPRTDTDTPQKTRSLLLKGLDDPKIVGKIYAEFFSAGIQPLREKDAKLNESKQEMKLMPNQKKSEKAEILTNVELRKDSPLRGENTAGVMGEEPRVSSEASSSSTFSSSSFGSKKTSNMG